MTEYISKVVPQLFFTVSDILSQVVGGVGHCHGLLRLSSSVAALPGIVIFRSRHTSNPGTLGSCNGFEHTCKYFKKNQKSNSIHKIQIQ